MMCYRSGDFAYTYNYIEDTEASLPSVTIQDTLSN